MTEGKTKHKSAHGSNGRTRGFHSVVVPVDLTATSDRVVGRVSHLPLADDVLITLLHVVPSSLPPGERLHAERDANRALTDEVRHLRKQIPRKATIEPVLKVGNAAKEIAACATKRKAELIVMGRGSGNALRDTFLGSTAERVVRQTKLPVLVVRLPARRTYARPALAIELDQSAHEAIRLMLDVLSTPYPRVEVIHAFEAPYGRLVYPSLTMDQVEEREQDLRYTALRQLAKVLAAGLEKAGLPPEEGPLWRTHVRYGSARTIVEKAIKKAQPDLLVLGTRGFSGAAYVFLGSVAGDLLRAAKCDVLMVPPTRR